MCYFLFAEKQKSFYNRLVLFRSNAGVEGVRVIAGKNRHTFLNQDFSAVTFAAYKVDGTAAFFFASCKNSFVNVVTPHADSTEFWKKSRMQVYDFVFVFFKDFSA